MAVALDEERIPKGQRRVRSKRWGGGGQDKKEGERLTSSFSGI